jgi:hypothetical protein
MDAVNGQKNTIIGKSDGVIRANVLRDELNSSRWAESRLGVPLHLLRTLSKGSAFTRSLAAFLGSQPFLGPNLRLERAAGHRIYCADDHQPRVRCPEQRKAKQTE